MNHPLAIFWRHAAAASMLALASLTALPAAAGTGPEPTPLATLATLRHELQVGDLVFIRVDALPFRKVAAATGSWTNHVGVVISTDGADALIAESTFPWSRTTPMARFVARSESGRVAVMRLDAPLSEAQRERVLHAAQARLGIVYDTGFDLHSRRQFCSRFAREVLIEATGTPLGEVETFAHLLERHPETGLAFWRLWYGGRIPWARETVTPASLLHSAQLHAAFDGRIVADALR